MGDTAAKTRSIRVRKTVFDQFFEIEEIPLASSGSGAETINCIVCRTPKIKDEPCQECASRPWRCMWCYAIRDECPKGPCASCGKYGITKILEREKSSIYVEDIPDEAAS